MMKMRQLLSTGLLVLALGFPAWAASPADCRVKIEAARATLLDMLAGNTDKDQQARVKDTAAAVDPCLESLTAPPGKDAQLNELKSEWRALKAMREIQLVPAILTGKMDEANTIATGVQQKHLDNIRRLLEQLE